jgi:hypothetical protein
MRQGLIATAKHLNISNVLPPVGFSSIEIVGWLAMIESLTNEWRAVYGTAGAPDSDCPD